MIVGTNRLNRYLCNFIFRIEEKLNVRADFIRLYSNIVLKAPQSLKQQYKSPSNYDYYRKIFECGDYIKKFDPQKKSLPHLIRLRKSIEISGSIFGYFDAIFTLGIIPALFIISIGSFYFHLSELMSYTSAIFCIIAAVFNLILYYLSLNAELLKKMMENLFINVEDLSDLGFDKKKDTIIGLFIWDSSICSRPDETFKGFLFLLIIKSISEKFFYRILEKMIRMVPIYMSDYSKNKGRIQLAKFLWSKRKDL